MGAVLRGVGDPLEIEETADPSKVKGEAPSIALVDPRYPHNVGGALRACACWGLKQLWWSGSRVQIDFDKGERLPREERMKGYKHVQLFNYDRFFDRFDKDVHPVAVELRPGTENLLDFQHPEKALYVFGPEDGNIPRHFGHLCHSFVVIPTHFCLNLAAAVNVVLYDRRIKRIRDGLEPYTSIQDMLKEHRGPVISNS